MQHRLRELTPTAELLVSLQPEEFGARIVNAMQTSNKRMFSAGEVLDTFYPYNNFLETAEFPSRLRDQTEEAVFEAWNWLEAQGLLIWSDFANGGNGWRRLSRRGKSLTSEEFKNFAAARKLPRDILHPQIEARVWSDFVRGHYDSAVLFAAKQVEVRLREAIRAGSDRYGVALVNDAFNEDDGVLIDRNALPDERRARRNLFMGFIGAYKNPLSHRDLDIDDPLEAIELVLMASHFDLREMASQDEAS